MIRSRPISFLAGAAVIPLSALAVAACGGGGATAATAPPKASTAATTAAKAANIRVAHSSLGKILVNSQGRTVYLFKADSRGKSACSGACAMAWPPLLATGKPSAGTGLTASKLGTIRRSDGTRQVTYNGHPLYLFIEDRKPGDVKGEGVVAFGAAWFVLSPAGNQISRHPTKHGGRSSSSRPVTPAAPKATTHSAPSSTTQPAAPPAAKPAPPAAKPAPPPAAKPAPPANSGIPQNGGGDGDADNNGGPSDGDGNI